MEVISLTDLEMLWHDAGVDAKVDTEALYLELIDLEDTPATNPRYEGGLSRFYLVKTSSHHRHVGTIHRIEMPDGLVPHSHPHDYTRRDCSRCRVPDPNDQPETPPA